MRIVVCDRDALIRDMVEAVVVRAGHEVVGVAGTTAAAVGLLETAQPDAVVFDLSLGYNTDFDIIESAIRVGALAIVFSPNGDAAMLGHHSVDPIFVPKPDLDALEAALVRLEVDDERHQVHEKERRQRPQRTSAGPPAMGIGDAQAFFEAVNEARPGDGMVSIESRGDAEAVGSDAAHLLRGSDRLLLFPTSVRFYLPGGGEEGVGSLLERIAGAGFLGPDSTVQSIIVRDGEHGTDAFDRLKKQGDQRELSD
jgi:CheY-like chemotaxis protein